MWTSTLEINFKRVVPTQILGFFWRGAYFSFLAPLQVRNLPRLALPDAQGNWVRVHNRLAGICGSDLHLIFADGDLRVAPAALPAHESLSYPGHEVVGEVVEIGDQVQNLQVGDRVVLQHGPNCLSAGVQPPCSACATGNYSLCENGDLPGPRPVGGGWSEEMLVHEQQLFRVPPEMTDEQAVLLEPAAVAVHAVLRRLPQAGEKVLIIGAGTIGLLVLQVIRALAPQVEISVMARHSFQVEQATRMGATHILYGENDYENIARVTGGKPYTGMLGNTMLLGGYDVIFDTVGSRHTTHHSLRWARARGTVVMIGLNLHHMNIDLSPIWYQEVNLVGATGHGTERWPLGTDQERSTFALAADLITHQLLHPEKLITHRFALHNFREALQVASRKKESRAIKVIFDAALLPASPVPAVRQAAHAPLPPLTASSSPRTPLSPETSAQALPLPPFTPAEANQNQDAPATGPSSFTMAHSEDFTADFENEQFSPPRLRRPPTPLKFRTTGDVPDTPSSIGPAGVTNPLPQALQKKERREGNPMAPPPSQE